MLSKLYGTFGVPVSRTTDDLCLIECFFVSAPVDDDALLRHVPGISADGLCIAAGAAVLMMVQNG